MKEKVFSFTLKDLSIVLGITGMALVGLEKYYGPMFVEASEKKTKEYVSLQLVSRDNRIKNIENGSTQSQRDIKGINESVIILKEKIATIDEVKDDIKIIKQYLLERR